MVRASVLVTALTAVAMGLTFLSQVVVAWLFGASNVVDGYLIAASFPLFVSGSVGGVISYSLVPRLASYNVNTHDSQCFLSLTFFGYVAVAMLVALVGVIGAPTIIGVLGSELEAELREDVVLMNRVFWISTSLTIVASHCAAVLNASQRFSLSLIVSLVPSGAMIIFGLILGTKIGPVAFAWGSLTGNTIAVVVLGCFVVSKLMMPYECPDYLQRAWRYFKRVPLVITAMACFTIYPLADAFWAATLGDGSVAYLGYAQRVLVSVGTLLVVGPSSVLAPHFAIQIRERNTEMFANHAAAAIKLTLLLSSAVVGTLSIMSESVVQILFERGAFDAVARQDVGELLSIMMVGLIPMVCSVIIFRALFARGAYSITAILSILGAIGYIVLSGVLSRFFALHGIGVAYVVVWWCLFSVSAMFALDSAVRRALFSGFGRFVVQVVATTLIAISVTMSAALWLMMESNDLQFYELTLRTLACVLSGLVASYLFVVRLLRIPEVVAVSKKFFMSGAVVRRGS